LPNSVEKPSPKHPLIEKYILKSNFIQARLFQEGLFIVLPIKNCEPNDRYTSEYNIIELVQHIVINSCATKETDPAEHPNWNNVENILVKHVGN
jgi:hypothetical protein